VDWKELEVEWRRLYHWAWADYYRFVIGWKSDFQMGSHTKRIVDKTIGELKNSHL